MAGLILDKFEGKNTPVELLAEIVKTKPSMGYMMLSESGFEVQSDLGEISDAKLLSEIQEGYPQRSVYYFQNYPAGMLATDRQPFTVLADKDNHPLVGCVLEGKFNLVVPDSAHTPEYNLVERAIRPKLDQLYRLSKQSIETVTLELETDFMKESLGSYITEGTITLMILNGTVLTYAKASTLKDMGHGSVAGTLTSAEAKPEVKKPSIADMVKNKVVDPIITAATTAAASVLPNGLTNKPLTTDQILQANFQKVRPPDNIKRPKYLKAWYRDEYGGVPKDWDKRPAIYLLKDRMKAEEMFKKQLAPPETATAVADAMAKAHEEAARVLKPTQLSAAERLRLRKAAEAANPKDPDAERFQKDVTTHHIFPIADTKSLQQKAAEEMDDLPIIPPEDIKDIQVFVLKYIDKDGKQLAVDPRMYQGFEKKIPSAFERLGLKGPSPTFDMKWGAFKEISRKYPDFMALMAFNYRNELIRMIVESSQTLGRPAVEDTSRPKSAADRLRERKAAAM